MIQHRHSKAQFLPLSCALSQLQRTGKKLHTKSKTVCNSRSHCEIVADGFILDVQFCGVGKHR